MAGQCNKRSSASPKRSTLEPDDGCHFSPGPGKKNLFGGGGGMDVCDSPQVCDSGVSMTSFGCEGMPSLGMSDAIKPKLTDPESLSTCVSVGYSSLIGHEDAAALEGRMEGLSISSGETITTTISSTQTAACSVVQPEAVDSHKEFTDRLELYFAPDDDGDTKLHLAIIAQAMDAVMFLVLAAASYSASLLDLQNFEFRQTALHLAVITNQPAIVRLLVNCGASPDIRDRQGNTALHLACSRGLTRCITEMIRQFSDEERTQLEQYCHSAGVPTFQLPAFRLPNLNAIDYEGRSCLHMVQLWKSDAQLASQRLPAIHFLVHNCCADINIQEGKSGHCLLHLAVKQADSELFTYLLQEPSVNVNLMTYSRLTALDIADMLGRRDMVRKLTAVAGQHSDDYVPDSGSESDDMDEYDDLVVGGQKLTINS